MQSTFNSSSSDITHPTEVSHFLATCPKAHPTTATGEAHPATSQPKLLIHNPKLRPSPKATCDHDRHPIHLELPAIMQNQLYSKSNHMSSRRRWHRQTLYQLIESLLSSSSAKPSLPRSYLPLWLEATLLQIQCILQLSCTIPELVVWTLSSRRLTFQQLGICGHECFLLEGTAKHSKQWQPKN